jgi:hypothetical protein
MGGSGNPRFWSSTMSSSTFPKVRCAARSGRSVGVYPRTTEQTSTPGDPAVSVFFNYGCNDSQLGHLYFVEGGLTGQPINTSPALTAVFTSMQDFCYWSRTQLAPYPLDAWVFLTDSGVQGLGFKVNQL